MKKNNFRILAPIIAAFLFGTLAVAFFGTWTVHIPLASVLLLVLISNQRNALLWVIVLGLVLETFSPFPIFTYFIALLCTFILLRVFVKSFVSNQTFFGALTASAFGVFIFEAGIYAFSRLGVLLSAGWVPTISYVYFQFILTRLVLTTLLVVVVFLFLQRFSPKIRGVMISKG